MTVRVTCENGCHVNRLKGVESYSGKITGNYENRVFVTGKIKYRFTKARDATTNTDTVFFIQKV
jgi:hypothetical protein